MQKDTLMLYLIVGAIVVLMFAWGVAIGAIFTDIGKNFAQYSTKMFYERRERLQLLHSNVVPKVHNLSSKAEVVHFLEKNEALCASMLDYLETSGEDCIAMHHFLHKQEKTYNFIVLNLKYAAESEQQDRDNARWFSPLWWKMQFPWFVYQNEPFYYLPMFNVRLVEQYTKSVIFKAQSKQDPERIRIDSENRLIVKEHSTLCPMAKPKLRDRSAAVRVNYKVPILRNNKTYVEEVERVFTDSAAVCIQKTLDEFKGRITC